MRIPKALEGHNKGTISLSRILLAIWFCFLLVVGCLAVNSVFFGKIGLPEGAKEIFKYSSEVLLMLAGSYVGRETTKRMGRKTHVTVREDEIDYD